MTFGFFDNCIAVCKLFVTTVLKLKSMRAAKARAVEELSMNTVLKSGRILSATLAARSFSRAFLLIRTNIEISSAFSGRTAPP